MLSQPRTGTPLPGEDLGTARWQDAEHWIGIYDDLIRFKQSVLSRVRHELIKLPPIAQAAAAEDVVYIGTQMDGYQARLELWYERLWNLRGLRLDPGTRALCHRQRDVVLTVREFQLLNFLVGHPGTFFTADQIRCRAWTDPALSVDEVRNYVARLRKIIARLDVPCQVLNRPGRGYALIVKPGPG